ncbi:MAG: 2-amino-4-hydroxy-6-hydroxymethyldihydropteridine diphosphokinase [Bacteroidales bacterium]
MENVFLSLGSNLGDRNSYLQYACQMIEQRIGVVEHKSSVYESAPWGYVSKNFFYNQVLQIQCNIEALELLSNLQQIEQELGRERYASHYVDRTLDIDILFFGEQVISLPQLTVPHPYITQRRFVLEPFSEIAPFFIHPVLKLTIQQLLEQCEDKSFIRKLESTT